MRGTTAEQDTRFGNKEAKALKNTKFSKQFETKVDVRKVNVSVLKPWIATTTAKVLGGVEDDILVEFVSEMLEDPATPVSYSNMERENDRRRRRFFSSSDMDVRSIE